MSIQIALQFMQLVRADKRLQNQLLDITHNYNLESCVQLGAEVGLIFSIKDLETAHKQDWGMRKMLYQHKIYD